MSMSADTPADEQGIDPQLKARLRKAERFLKIRALLLVVPLMLFVLFTFVMPLAEMLYRSVHNPVLVEAMPEVARLMQEWDSQELPGEEIYAAVGKALVEARKEKTIGRIANRLNSEYSGMRSLLTGSARKLQRYKGDDYKNFMLQLDPDWGEAETWGAFKVLSSEYTLTHYLAAFDMQYDSKGKIVPQPEERQIYVDMLLKTLKLSLLVTVFCVLLGYPLAYYLSILPPSKSNLLMILVLLPFWTSLLVRTSSWIVMLQGQGVVNSVLLGLGVIGEPLDMMYNQIGTVVAMTHILLPFMILPTYSVMKSISPVYMRAARSLGATPAHAFMRVYFPQTVPGLSAGAILVFILSIGYYITPALVGGRTGQMISNLIAYHMQTSLNWGLGAALAGSLLVVVLVLYWIYNRLVGASQMKLG
ncbi:ABC transporter permease [Aestuariirhabdus litorea]|uniref:ABC transporter permease n=1 Tax=Aestuariirhabdus litorea TaxID=2528527 RepID=A0A3P3VL17_9GAMM|nr:ABC transporter permease [Aestuariirhabdus litorea]RRJ83084.1 ABC transporter permease [Aestuariirhabdus litorea]RWW93241.1 ABC transporter permease subunit [Endozoicomonadaceae bacterium GTF-13]